MSVCRALIILWCLVSGLMFTLKYMIKNTAMQQRVILQVQRKGVNSDEYLVQVLVLCYQVGKGLLVR